MITREEEENNLNGIKDHLSAPRRKGTSSFEVANTIHSYHMPKHLLFISSLLPQPLRTKRNNASSQRGDKHHHHDRDPPCRHELDGMF